MNTELNKIIKPSCQPELDYDSPLHLLLPVRMFVLGVLILFISPSVLHAQSKTFTNPLITTQDSPDPWMVCHHGYYYLTATFDPSGGIWIWKAKSLAGFDQATKVQIHVAPPTGLRSKQIWAPELHLINNHWYVYYTASDGIDENHRLYVLESSGTDPLGPYTFKAKLQEPGADNWALDPTILRKPDGSLFLLWVAHLPGKGNGIKIAPMSNPWTISGSSVIIARPQYSWEQSHYPINEGPEVLERNGTYFVIYSASDTGTPDYALGMLTNIDGEVMNPNAWVKSPKPVFRSFSGQKGNVYGPGHNGFFKSPDGIEDWIIYHGKETSEYTYKGRQARAQRFDWNADGTPNFGRPIPRGVRIPLPSGESLK